MDVQADGPAAAPGARVRSRSLELARVVLPALVVSVLLKAFVVQAFFIPSGSMEPTLHGCPGCRGDRVLVEKISYGVRDVTRGEIVVFRGTGRWLQGEGDKDFVKRVVALPGETVACCDRGGRVTVDGRPLSEPYLHGIDQQPFTPVTLGAGQLWVMGDNRSSSSDSRFRGPVRTQDVVGRAFVIVWPLSRWAALTAPPDDAGG